MNRVSIMKGLSGLATLLTTFWGQTPGNVRDAAMVAVLFICIDTLTGLLAAFAMHQVSSRSLRDKLLAKLTQYAALEVLCGGLCILMHSSSWLAAGCYMIVGIEGLSIIETITKLQDYGVDMGPAAPFFARMTKYFGDMAGGSSPGSTQTVAVQQVAVAATSTTTTTTSTVPPVPAASDTPTESGQ